MSFKTNLDVSINVWNERENKWEKAELVPGEEEVIMDALDAIKSNYQVGQALHKEGAILELRGKSIWLSTTNTKIGAPLTKVAEAVKRFSKNALKSEPQELTEPDVAKKEGGVVIKVRVIPAKERVEQFGKDYEKELAHSQDVQQVNELFNEEELSDRLKKSLDTEQYYPIQQKLQTVTDAQKEVTHIMGEAKRLLNEGKDEEAIKYYAQNMPSAFETYCNALNDWVPESRFLDENVERNPFQFDQLKGPSILIEGAKTLFAYTRQTKPWIFQMGEALKQIENHAINFEKRQATVRLYQQEIASLVKEEQSFSINVSHAILELNSKDLLSILKEDGDQELEEYPKKLLVLSSLSGELQTLLKDINRFIELGAIKEGMELYKDALNDLIPRYNIALRELVIPQLVAARRFPDVAPFKLNLSRLELHQRFLSAVGSELASPLNKINTAESALFPKSNDFKTQRNLGFWDRRAFAHIHEGYSKVIKQLYEKERAVAREANPVKRRALNAQLKQLLIKLTPEIQRLGKQFVNKGGEAKLESSGVSQELRTLLSAQREYIHDFGERHHLFVRWEDNTIAKTFPKFFTLDNDYNAALIKQGWDQEKIARLNTLYDDYNKALQPIKLAYERLNEDPENSILQKQLRDVYSRQLDKINKLGQQLTLLGGIPGIEGLEKGVAEYQKILSERNLGEGSKPYLRQFDKINFSVTLKKGNSMLEQVSKLMKQRLSWEKGYIDHLTTNQEVRNLFEGYQYHLRKMNELERRLEAFATRDLLSDLKSELEYRAYELTKLDEQREKLQKEIEKTPSVQKAFEEKIAFKREAYRFLNLK